jgi:hypothetical protein
MTITGAGILVTLFIGLFVMTASIGGLRVALIVWASAWGLTVILVAGAALMTEALP